jgi:Glycosyltransferase family 87
MDRDRLAALWRAALPVLAVLSLVVGIGATIAAAGDTLGYDYQAYVHAARRALDGQALYDPAVDVAGGFAIFLYPPPFALALVPFAILGEPAGLWLWLALLVAAFVAGVAILPVRPTVRWLILLLGGLSFPLTYAIKLGQVGPLLLLLFAIGWRWRDRPVALGLSIAAGTLIKVQPIILAIWAALTGRWRAAAVAVVALLAAGVISVVAFGPGVVGDYVALLNRVSSPVTTPHNFTLGAVLFQSGVPEGVATLVQAGWLVAILAIVLVAIRYAPDDVSFVTAAVASQMLSPLLWDHYAVVLLLPTAWLLDRGHWWAVAIPLLTALPVITLIPPVVYPIAFTLGLVAPLATTLADRSAVGPVANGRAGA